MNKLNRVEIITKPELEDLIDSLVTDAEFHPYAIYGLMFLFSSIRKLAESGDRSLLEQIWTDALIKLYSVSENVYQAIDDATDNIHLHYRAADFTLDDQSEIAESFIKSECIESVKSENILDLSESPADDLARTLSDLLTNPEVPPPISDGLSQILTDFFNDHIDQSEFVAEKDSPEYIARLLRAFTNQQDGGAK